MTYEYYIEYIKDPRGNRYRLFILNNYQNHTPERTLDQNGHSTRTDTRCCDTGTGQELIALPTPKAIWPWLKEYGVERTVFSKFQI